MLNAKITGIASYLPDYVLTNDELSHIVDTNDEWITTRVGMKERRILKQDVGSSYMGIKAVEKLLAEMARAGGPRTARFRCVVTLIRDGKVQQFDGCLEGEIALQREGRHGFGYDPVFIPREYPGLTLAEISEHEKNAISHRGKALRAMAAELGA